MSAPRPNGDAPLFQPGLHRFALLTAFSTLLLVTAGGLVTSTGSSLAVPDWPLSFGQVFPRMEGGVLYEHGHRMVATFVGMLTLVLMIWVLRKERRRAVRRLAVGAFLAVVLQGLLGGITVLLRLPLPVSVGHACLGQIFFCLTVTLTLVTSREWTSSGPEGRPGREASSPATLSLATTALVFLQLILGALVRHSGAGLAIPDFPLSFGRIVPPILEGRVLIAYSHRLGALAVSLLVLFTAGRILFGRIEDGRLRRPAVLMVALLFLQVALGGLTVLSQLAVVPATAHVVTGALLLAVSLVLSLRSCRLAYALRDDGAERERSGDPRGARAGWAVR